MEHKETRQKNKWRIKCILQEHYSYQCDGNESASLRIRPFRVTLPQISPSIPSETDYPGLSQTHGIITGSPRGHCSLPAPQLETHWVRWCRGNAGVSLSLSVSCTNTHTQTRTRTPTRVLVSFIAIMHSPAPDPDPNLNPILPIT